MAVASDPEVLFPYPVTRSCVLVHLRLPNGGSLKKAVIIDGMWKKPVFKELLLVAEVADFFQNSSARILRMHVLETVLRWRVIIRGIVVVVWAYVFSSFWVIVTLLGHKTNFGNMF